MDKPQIFARYRSCDEELLGKLCEKMSRQSVSVSMLPRFGFSGARLFIVSFTERGLPQILKVAPIKKAQEEFEALESMKDVGIEDCNRVSEANRSLLVSNSREWGGILYPHMGTDQTDEAENSVTLRQRLFLAERPYDPLSDAAMKTILMEVFARLRNAHRNPRWESRPLAIAYDRYFRKHESQRRIRQILGRLVAEETFPFLGAVLYNPLRFIDSLPESAVLPMGRVHGDLHPDNVVLHRCGTPHLIDFAWAKDERDILVDFVLMENSIRFRDFPRTVNLDEQLEVDDTLTKDNTFEGIPSWKSFDQQNKDAYNQLAVAVSLIRLSAKSVLGSRFSVERYLFCQFIVLYGLFRFEGYEPYTSIRALGIIAKRLHDGGWSFLDR
jgi:hypothetical protein